MKNIILLSILVCIGCSTRQSDIKLNVDDIKKIVEGADSETWCEMVYCVNGVYSGPIKLHAFKKNGKAQQIIISGISRESQNEYKSIKKKRIENQKYDAFIKKLIDVGIFDMNDIDLTKLPAKESAENPWEDSFTQIPSATSFIEFIYFIRIGKREHKFYGFEIDIFKDGRYKKVVELFNNFFEQKLGGNYSNNIER